MSLFTDIGRWEGYRERIYLDHAGIPTIGVGYNLRNPVVLRHVLNQFGYSVMNLGSDFDDLAMNLEMIFTMDWTNDNLADRVEEVDVTH